MLFAEMAPLFAQRGGFAAGGGGGGGGSEAALMVMLVVYVIVLIASLVLGIMFMITQYKALSACSPRNRTMEPGQVFFVFIPIAGIIFAIMALFKIPESFEREFRSRGIRGGPGEDYGKSLAMWYVLTAFLCPIPTPVLFIMYWVKIAKLTKQLNSGARGGGGYDDDDRDRGRGRDDDYDDDRDRRRSRDDDRDDDDDRPRRRY